MVELEDKYRMYVNAYIGLELIDEYPLKPYVLEELKEYINEYQNQNGIRVTFKDTYMLLNKNFDYLNGLQDALWTMNELNAPIDLIHIIEKRIKNAKENI